MIPYRERELCQRFYNGESISSREFNNGGLDFYSDFVHPQWKQDKVTKQEDLWGEIWHTLVNPTIVLTANQEHRLTQPLKRNGFTANHPLDVVDKARKEKFIEHHDGFNPTQDEKLAVLRWQIQMEKRK